MYTQYFIDDIVPNRSINKFIIFCSALFFNLSVIEIFQYHSNILQEKIRLSLQIDLDSRVINSICNSRISDSNITNGNFHANKISKDINDILDFTNYLADKFVANIVTFIWVVSYSFTISPIIPAVIILIFYPSYLYFKKVYANLRDKIYQLRDNHSNIETFRIETLSGLKTLKLLNACSFRLKRYKKYFDEFIKKSVKLSIADNNPQIVHEVFFEFLPLLFVFSLGGYFVLQGDLSLGKWIALNIYSSEFIGPLSRIANIGGRLSVLDGTIKRLQFYMNLNPEDKTKSELIKDIENIHELELKNVSFAYQNDNFIINNVNMKFVKGNIYAIIGPSGSGKSTIGKLLTRIVKEQAGNYCINGIDSDNISTHTIRDKISVTSVSDYIFSESIYDNIIIAKNDAGTTELNKAIELANAGIFINKCPEGLMTKLGENGLGLSDGQKQRILLSRQFLMKSDVVIIDEATSALDSKSEKKVIENIISMNKDKIIIFISHHPSVIKNASEIFILENGNCCARGTHDELKEVNAFYRDLAQRG